MSDDKNVGHFYNKKHNIKTPVVVTIRLFKPTKTMCKTTKAMKPFTVFTNNCIGSLHNLVSRSSSKEKSGLLQTTGPTFKHNGVWHLTSRWYIKKLQSCEFI